MPDSDHENLHSFEPLFPASRDPRYQDWRAALDRIELASAVTIREALASGVDARKMRDLQTACEPLVPQMISRNVAIISEQIVLLAEVGGIHVGFCTVQPQPSSTDFLVVQVIGVVPEARGHGVGIALLAAAASRYPGRSVAFATLDTNSAALALGRRYAASLGGALHRLPRTAIADRELGTKRGDGYRIWAVQTPDCEHSSQR